MLTMKCPDCQEDLIEVPTNQGPGLDVCSSGHGLWLDVGEVNFFVEDYISLKRAIGDSGRRRGQDRDTVSSMRESHGV